MSEELSDQPVFNYVASIQGREFIVTLMKNRMSHWDELSERSLTQAVQDTGPDMVIEVEIADEIFARALEMAANERLEEAKTSGSARSPAETAKETEEMDRLLETFFWEKVNPRLVKPLTRSVSS